VADMKGERSVVIAAPTNTVYEYLSDFPRHTEWNHGPVDMQQMTPGPVGVGTVFQTREQLSSNLPPLMAKVVFPMMKMMLGVKDYRGRDHSIGAGSSSGLEGGRAYS